MNRKLVLEVEESLYSNCQGLAKMEERSLAGLVRQALKEYVMKNERSTNNGN